MNSARSTINSVSWEESEGLDYVTIAKAGGRKDLLAHVEQPSPPHQPHKPSVEWFAHPTPPPTITDKNYESTVSKSWMQWSCPSQLPQLVMEEKPIVKVHQRTRSDTAVKLPQLRSSEAVDFSRLLALDYQREWLEERETKQAEQRQRAKLKRATQKKKLREHTVKASKIAGALNSSCESQNKQRFIMKRFANVPARVKLPPL